MTSVTFSLKVGSLLASVACVKVESVVVEGARRQAQVRELGMLLALRP